MAQNSRSLLLLVTGISLPHGNALRPNGTTSKVQVAFTGASLKDANGWMRREYTAFRGGQGWV